MTATHRSLFVLFITAFLLAGYNFLGAAWTPAAGTPPANNTDAPVNIGTVTQAKSGNLSANIFAATTEVRSNRYCDALGENCFSATSTPGGGGGDTIDVGGQCFEPTYLVVCNWNWSGSGNDDSTVLVNFNTDPTQGCRTTRRSYVRHSVVLAECGIGDYRWVESGWGACSAPSRSCGNSTGTQTRTVNCVDTSDAVVADSFCTTAKPAVSQTCSRNFGSCR